MTRKISPRHLGPAAAKAAFVAMALLGCLLLPGCATVIPVGGNMGVVLGALLSPRGS
jgi:hypothetical protein